MQKINIYTLITIGLWVYSSALFAQVMSIEQVLQRAIDNNISLKIAVLQTERATYEKVKVESMLGWQISNQTNLSRDVGFTGTPSNVFRSVSGVNRMLNNGDSIGASANYSLEDSEFVFSPSFPNPAHRLNLDVNYRKPLWRDASNPIYSLGLQSADLGTQLTLENKLMIKDQFAAQVIETYYVTLLTQAGVHNIQRAAKRTKRLIKFIKKNQQLGLAEEKDLLQVNAQLQTLMADLSNLELAWVQQQVTINNLMGRDHRAEFLPILDSQFAPLPSNEKILLSVAIKHAPAIRLQDARIELANASIARIRNSKKNKLDAIASLGTRSAYGENSLNATINEHDFAVTIGIEYTRAMDKRGINAEIQQAMLDKSIALQEIENIKRELKYSVLGFKQEINFTNAAIIEHQKRIKQEKRKLAEATERYRRGRTDTQQLILFENDLSTAEFLLEQKRIDLARRHARLDLLRGKTWEKVIPLSAINEGVQ